MDEAESKMNEEEFRKKISTELAKLTKATKEATLALTKLGIAFDRQERADEWHNSLTPIEKTMRYIRNVFKYYPLNCPKTESLSR